MKKNKTKRRITSLALAVVIALSGVSVGISNNAGNVYAAKLSKNKQHKIYQSVIKKYDKKMKSNMKKFAKENPDRVKESDYHTYYAFVDIDKNGIDECFLRYVHEGKNYTSDQYSFGETTALFTINGKKAKAVINIPSGYDNYAEIDPITIYKGSSMIRYGIDSSAWAHSYREYKNGKIDQKAISFSYVSSENSWDKKNHASIDDRKVSVAEYKKQEKKCMGTGKGYLMKKYK